MTDFAALGLRIQGARPNHLQGHLLTRICEALLGVDRSKVTAPEKVLSRLREMGINDPNKVYDTNGLAPGKKIMFAATGATDGALLTGVRFFGGGKHTHAGY